MVRATSAIFEKREAALERDHALSLRFDDGLRFEADPKPNHPAYGALTLSFA